MNKISLNIPYNDIPVLSGQEAFYQKAAQQLSGHVHHLFPGGKRLAVAIYGSNQSGKIACDILSRIDRLDIVHVFDKNPRPYEPLSHISHVNLYRSAIKRKLDLVVLGTSPNHYAEIEPVIEHNVSCDCICGLYAEETGVRSDESFVSLSVNRRYGFKEETPEYLPVIKKRSALVMIDIWNTRPGVPCPLCRILPRLVGCFREEGLLVINAPTYSPKETPCLRIPTSKIRVREKPWPPHDFYHRQGMFSYLDSSEEGNKPENDIHRPVCTCVGSLDGDNEVTVLDFDAALQLLEDRGILYLFYVGGAILQCLMHKPLGWLNLLEYGYLPIMVRDACVASDATLEGRPVDVKSAGIVHFESQCGFSTSVDDLIHAFHPDFPAARQP